MKTPRDLLFARHQAAAPKLDAIRRAAVAAAGDRHNFAGRRPPTAATNIFLTLWQELFLPGRRIWSGLAGAWVYRETAQPDSGKLSAYAAGR